MVIHFHMVKEAGGQKSETLCFSVSRTTILPKARRKTVCLAPSGLWWMSGVFTWVVIALPLRAATSCPLFHPLHSVQCGQSLPRLRLQVFRALDLFLLKSLSELQLLELLLQIR